MIAKRPVDKLLPENYRIEVIIGGEVPLQPEILNQAETVARSLAFTRKTLVTLRTLDNTFSRNYRYVPATVLDYAPL